MKFSVLMSVYFKDDPIFFKLALESVTTQQTVKPSQVVIVKDGPVSTEINSIITKVEQVNEDIEFTVLFIQNNSGLACALNRGIEVCKYEWIARMDSDDISLPDRFEKQIEFLTNHPEVSLLGGTISEFSEYPGDMMSERHTSLSHNDILKMAKKRTPFNHMSVIYRKDDVKKAGGYSENFGKLEDYKLWIDMLLSGTIASNIDDVIVYARVGNGFINRRSNKREITDWDMLQKYLIKSKMVTKYQAFKNKFFIRVFIHMPAWMKKLAYKTVLRRKRKNEKV